MAFLEVKNFYKSFGDTKVLKGVDFDLEKGQVLVLIGSSGSGKTTLLRCLNFLETPDVGTITLNEEVLFDANKLTGAKGTKMKRDSDEDIRKKRLRFGMVFQSFNLFPQYNVLRNVTLAMDLRAKEKLVKPKLFAKVEEKKAYKKALETIYQENKEKALELIEKVGLSEKINNYPCELSGGQCQRVAIARALALNPDILCFDEPTSALDPELTGEVLKVIKGLKSADSTMIVVTHEMEFARSVADKVIFMADGIIEEEGTPEEVFGNPKSLKTQSFLQKSNEGI